MTGKATHGAAASLAASCFLPIRNKRSLRHPRVKTGRFTMRGVRDTIVLISLDNPTYVPLGLFTIAQAPGSDTYAGDFVNVAAFNGGNPLPFRYFQLDIQSSWGGDSNFFGLSEIMFEGQIVPEPGSALLLSVATAGLLARRRR